MYYIEHHAFQQCQLQSSQQAATASGQVAGPSLASLVSPGTEIHSAYAGESFPRSSGYASVFHVEEIGGGVSGFEIGDLVFCMGNHASWSTCDANNAISVPSGLAPTVTVMARLMGVSQTTLSTCKARPGDRVFITGLGPVGFLAALQFQLCGYEVFASDPNPGCCQIAGDAGITVINSPEEIARLHASLAIDCSGHESAVLQCAQALRRCGELVLIGVPWKQRSDASAHTLLDLVFHRYIYLRSGWEWEIPRHSDHFNQMHSVYENLSTCLRWLADGRIQIPDGIIKLFHPQDCDAVYQGHLHQSHKHLCSIFDWTQLHTQGLHACNA